MSYIDNENDIELFWSTNKCDDLLDYSSIFTNEISTQSAPSANSTQSITIVFPQSRPAKKTYFAIRKVARTKRSDDLTPSKFDESDLDVEELKYMSSQEKLNKMRILSRQVKKYKCILENISRKFDDKVEKIFKRKLSVTTKSSVKSTKKVTGIKKITLKKVIKALKNINYTENPEPFDTLISHISKGKDFLESTNFKTISQELRILKGLKKTERVRSNSLNSLFETTLSKKNSNDESSEANNNNAINYNIDFGGLNYDADYQNDYNLASDFFNQEPCFDDKFNFGI